MLNAVLTQRVIAREQLPVLVEDPRDAASDYMGAWRAARDDRAKTWSLATARRHARAIAGAIHWGTERWLETVQVSCFAGGEPVTEQREVIVRVDPPDFWFDQASQLLMVALFVSAGDLVEADRILTQTPDQWRAMLTGMDTPGLAELVNLHQPTWEAIVGTAADVFAVPAVVAHM